MSTTRRNFLELSGRMAAMGIVLGRMPQAHAAAAEHLTYGVQMFEVRKQAEKDLAGAFKSIKEAGFDNIELYPIAYKQPPAQLKQMLADAGLACVSGHFDYTGRDQSIEYAHGLGLKYLVCPMLPEAQKLSLDGFRKATGYFNEWGESAKKAGIQFVFHNHDYEFKPQIAGDPGSTGWAELMKGTDAGLVKLEFDLFWLTTAGKDPAEMLRKYADRAVLVHLKDRVPGAPQSYLVDEKATSYCTELGKGTVNWPGLLRQAKSQGIEYAFLDQDDTKIPVEESMKESRAYLRKIAV